MKAEYNSWKVDRLWSRVRWQKADEKYHGPDGGYFDGCVITPFGIVDAYSQRGKSNYTRIDFVWNGRCHTKTVRNKFYGKRGLATVSARFAREVAGTNR